MEKVVLASNNPHKLNEIKEILKDFGYSLHTAWDMGFTEEVEENGATFEENSLIKAKTVQEALGEITIADDSGLMVEALGGDPGVRSARYAAETADYAMNNRKLLSSLEGVPFNERRARFVSVITMLFPSGEKIVCRGEIEGFIALQEAGDKGFGYDPLFYLPVHKKTFAELDAEEKNRISHRAKALQALKEALSHRK